VRNSWFNFGLAEGTILLQHTSKRERGYGYICTEIDASMHIHT